MILNYFTTWIALVLVKNVTSKKCGYDSCPKSVPDKLNVHLGPFLKYANSATSMFVTDIGDEMCWRKLYLGVNSLVN